VSIRLAADASRLTALIVAERDPWALADLAKGTGRAEMPELGGAFGGPPCVSPASY
jgi:hypothetical protein